MSDFKRSLQRSVSMQTAHSPAFQNYGTSINLNNKGHLYTLILANENDTMT